jgi:hypothetical protein
MEGRLRRGSEAGASKLLIALIKRGGGGRGRGTTAGGTARLTRAGEVLEVGATLTRGPRLAAREKREEGELGWQLDSVGRAG